MYPYLHEIFADKKGGTVFSCFSVWHFLYLAVIFGPILLSILHLRKKDRVYRQKAIKGALYTAFGLYIADLFLMPFAYGYIDMEKLPFHMCTLMCLLSFLSYRGVLFKQYRKQFALLGLVSNLIYVLYPAGVGWYQIHPLSYRAVQTLLFHGAMTAYGILTLALGDDKLTYKCSLQELPVIVAITLWAIIGNTLYNGTAGEYDHMFNWFFVVRDPFNMLPANIAPLIMPFVMILVIYAADLLIYSAYFAIKNAAVRNELPHFLTEYVQ
jgi:hypothetical protein